MAYRNGKKVPRRPYKKNFLYNEPNVTAKQLGKLIFSLKWDKNDIFVSTSPEDKIKCFNTDNFGFKWEIKGLGEYNIIADGFNDYAIFVVANDEIISVLRRSDGHCLYKIDVNSHPNQRLRDLGFRDLDCPAHDEFDDIANI